ncbi:MAG: hemolysin III family protein [Pseudomonadota bacterium]
MTQVQSSYPAYAKSELIADAIVHLLGITFALAGSIYLLGWATAELGSGQITALSVYCTTIVLAFGASAFYHMTPWENFRPLLRRFDHAAIYFKIAGTYTPLVVMIGSLSSYIVLGLVWTLATVGSLFKLFDREFHSRKSGTFLYLALGWMCVLIIYPLGFVVPENSIWLIISGGLIYTAGVVFYKWESLMYSNAIWHGFVFVASCCFFAAITLGAFYEIA